MTNGRKIALYLESASDYRIVDDDRRVYTIDEARTAWETGRVENYNMSFFRLVRADYDIEEAKRQFAEMDAARCKAK